MTIWSQLSVYGSSRSSNWTGRVVGKLGFGAWVVVNLPKRIAKQKSRRALLSLTDDQLHDIGKTREEATAEASQPFWK